MASQTSKRFRLVKCPKCLKILQEDEDVPVYQCGGCSAILQAKRRSVASNITPSPVETERETERTQANEPGANNVFCSSRQDTVHSSSGQEGTRTNEPEANNVSNSSREDKVLSSSGHEGTRTNESEANNVSNSSREDTVLPSSGHQGTRTNESEANNVSNSSREDKVLPSSGHEGARTNESEADNVSCRSREDAVLVSSSRQEYEMESVEKKLGELELTHGDETSELEQQECSPGDPEKIEQEENSGLESDMMTKTEAEVAGYGASSGGLSVGHVVAARASDSSGNDEISPDASPIVEKNEVEENSGLESGMMMNTVVVEAAGSEASSGRLSVDRVVAARASDSSGNAEASPDASPIEEKQTKGDDYLENKTSSAYDGSESSSEEREEDRLLDENEQWNALAKIRSGKFEMRRYPEDEGASSSSTFAEKRRNETTAYNERYQNRSLQLEGPGGRLGRQGRRHVTEQLRPDIPFYPREQPYTRVSPSSYPSHDEFDRYSRAHSLQMPPYAGGGMNYESVDYIYHNNIGARRGLGRFSGEMASDRTNRNHPGWYSGQLHNAYSSYSASPQRLMEQPEYYQRWSNEIVSDVEDHHQRNRQANHHHELQNRRQCVAKRHVRPTAGGAPFISCYRCSENLQLPVDFLIFKKKHHLLRCGTCNTVLRFSLHSRTHLIPAGNRSTNSSSVSPTDKAAPEAETLSTSAQDEDLPVTRGSPLHRLLGYSTVSQVFKASQRPPSL